MTIKYAKKAQILFKKKQVSAGTPIANASIVAADAVAVFNSDFATNLENETFQYSGDELDRDEGVTITDKYSEVSAETFIPAGGVQAGAPSDTTFPLAHLFTSAGGAITYSGTAATAQVKVSNATASNDLLTVVIAKVSQDRATKQKNYKFYDCRAQLDLDIQVGSRAKLKWTLKGNPVDALGQAYPEEIDKVTPTYGTQKTVIAPVVKLATIQQAELVRFGSLGYTTGTTDLPAAFSGTVKNICFSKLSAPNFFGFDYSRFLTGCEEGFAKSAVATDVTLTILEDAPDATWNPDASYTGSGTAMLEGFFALALYWGTVQGQKQYVEFSKLQLMDVKNADISGYSGKDLVFKNTGTSSLYFT